MFERFHKNRYGYTRWDGSQQIDGLDADDVLKALSDDYLENGNLQQALKRLMQDGVRGEDGRRAMGLREMMERMRNSRKEQLNRYNMASGVMDDLREKLEEINNLEREGIQKRLDNQNNASDQQPQDGSPQSAQDSEGSAVSLWQPFFQFGAGSICSSPDNPARAAMIFLLSRNRKCWR